MRIESFQSAVPAVLLVLFFMTVSWILYGGYLTDDSYIHFVYARNLAEGAGFSFNPGEPSYGSTSPLWVLLLAAGTVAGIETVTVAQALSLLASAGCVLALWIFARRTGTVIAAQLMPPLALAANPWFQRWSVSGMEVGLAALLAMSGFYAALVSQRGTSARLAGGLLLGLGVLARPEIVLLLGLSFLAFIVLGRFVHAAQFAFAAAIPLIIWALFAFAHFGTILPNSFLVKHDQTTSNWQSALDSMMILAASDLAPLLAIAVSFGLVAFVRRGSRIALAMWLVWLIPLIWTAGVIFQYSYRGVNVASRYMCLLTPILLLCSAWWVSRGFEWVADRRYSPSRIRVVSIGLIVVAVLQPLAIGALTWRSVQQAERGYSENHHAIADWLDQNATKRDLIATYDVGIIAYRTRRQIIDMAGLTDTYATRAQHVSVQDRLLTGQPAYVVMQGRTAGDYARGNPALARHLEEVFSTEMDWGPGRSVGVFTVYRGRW